MASYGENPLPRAEVSRNPNDREGAPRLAARDPAVLAALALIAVATLTPGGGRGGWAPGLPDPADVLVNLAVFLPLGLALRRYRWTVVRVLVVAVLISLVVEVAQLTIVLAEPSGNRRPIG